MSNSYKRVEDNPDFVKDMSNFAILNTNKAAIRKHELKMAEFNRNKHVDAEINNLKSEMSDIKNIMNKILCALEKTEK